MACHELTTQARTGLLSTTATSSGDLLRPLLAGAAPAREVLAVTPVTEVAATVEAATQSSHPESSTVRVLAYGDGPAGHPPRPATDGTRATVDRLDEEPCPSAVASWLDDRLPVPGADRAGEVLVFVAALAPFLDATSLEETHRFLYYLTAQAPDRLGSLYCHLEATRSPATVTALAPLFEATVEPLDDGWVVETRA
ncbi:DUF7504 family protein [Haloarchaeobius amylolyticus]|uniref:DUF7504 family protein n=1 Tax=Haloarchaeobius amylolyticus TaxID=1198296 RepID=UPI00226E4DB8|nr:hypothetical protein [Haloarchaeobius amylolyticus]